MGLFSWLFRWMCKRVFDRVDYNKNGRIEALEVEVAILQLYNQINKRLPGWQNPPTRDQIQMALRAYDTDGNGTLEFNEFVEFAASLVNTGPDQFFARMGRHALIETAIMPAAAKGLKAIVGGPLQNTPMVFLAPGLAVGIRALRGLLPF